jgi:sec-independent protein translocase protein TatB
MFDMGFAEIVLIAVIGLIVVGPKRMPEAVRVLGYWLGKLRRTVHKARQDMEREFGLDDIRRDLHNEELLVQLEQERKSVEQSLSLEPSNPAAPKIESEQEMMKAFDDFDKEFGTDGKHHEASSETEASESQNAEISSETGIASETIGETAEPPKS